MIIHKEGERLFIEPVRTKGLKVLLATLSSLQEDFPEIIDTLVESEDIFDS